jgi:hypothetical protein
VDVISRAADFARIRGISHIWIDQECIDQTNDADVQNHLQCMHHIYRRAQYTVGLLNFELSNWGQFVAMLTLATLTSRVEQNVNEPGSSLEFLRDIKGINFMTRLLKSVRRDRWFSRTWVFQERFSSLLNMCLLFQTSSDVKSRMQALPNTASMSRDVAVSCETIESTAAIWLHTLRQNSMETAELHLVLRVLHIAVQRVSTISYGLTFETLLDILETGQNPHERDRPLPLKDIFHHIESCDNQIVSDRVAIFANVLNLDWRINSTGLSSYSLSLLTILQLNKYLPRVLIRQPDEDDVSSLFVQGIEISTLIDEALRLRHFSENGHETSAGDLTAVNNVLGEIELLNAHKYDTDSREEDFSPGGRYHSLVPLLVDQVPNIRVATVIPMSVTIEGIFSAMIRSASAQRVDLSRSYGSEIVRYGIENGQLPKRAKFLAFFWGLLLETGVHSRTLRCGYALGGYKWVFSVRFWSLIHGDMVIAQEETHNTD